MRTISPIELNRMMRTFVNEFSIFSNVTDLRHLHPKVTILTIIDTHSHMYLDQFANDRGECMKRALDQGVQFTLLPNIDSQSIEALKQTIQDYPGQCKGMMGLHPCSVKGNVKRELTRIKDELYQGDYIAVGEIGIDLYWDESTLGEQVEAFKEQIRWAKELDLPIVIHARESFQEIFEIMDQVDDTKLRGVFHCFSGTINQAEKALSYEGFYLGIGGVVTFKNSGLDQVVKDVGINRLMLETDAPYLTPQPFRGKRNETAYTRFVAEKLSEILELNLEEVAEITTHNALKLFNLSEI